MMLDRMVKWLLPREERFYALLERAAECVSEAGSLFLDCCRKDSFAERAPLIEELHRIEHRADDVMHEVNERLNRTFVTPIDRADIFALASQLENVVDAIFATARQIKVHAMETLPSGSLELAFLIKEACENIREAVGHLRRLKNFPTIRAICKRLSALESQGDAIFGDQIGHMFRTERDAITILKNKEFLEDLERTLDVCDHVGTALDTILIKNA